MIFGPIWLVSVTYAVLVCVSLIVQDLRYAFIPASGATLLFLSGGFLMFRRLRGAFSIPWPSLNLKNSDSEIVIEGTALLFREYEQDLIISFRTRRLQEIIAITAIAATTLVAILLRVVSAEPLIHGWSLFLLELVCFAGLGFLVFSLRWLLERRSLPGSRVAVGEILGRDPGFLRAGVSYQFFDSNRERRGGRGPLGFGTDNAVLVFYDPNNPDKNSSQSGFRFHEFKLELIPHIRSTAVS